MAPPPPVIDNIEINLHTTRVIIAFEPLGVTRYNADDIIGDIKFEFAVKCWESIKNKIARTLIHYIPNLANEVEKIFHFIEDITINCFSTRRMVIEVIEDAKKLNRLESSLSSVMKLEQWALGIEKL